MTTPRPPDGYPALPNRRWYQVLAGGLARSVLGLPLIALVYLPALDTFQWLLLAVPGALLIVGGALRRGWDSRLDRSMRVRLHRLGLVPIWVALALLLVGLVRAASAY